MAQLGFNKRAKLSKTDHLFILLFLLGVLYLISNVWHLIPWNVPVYALFALYAVFWLLMEHSSVNGKIYQTAIAHFPRQYNSFGTLISKQPKIAKTYRKALDFKGYISNRSNRNMFIAGRSGSGKSTLMRYIIGIFPNSAKTIFSFKAGDEYLKLGIPILRISDHAGDPFTDKEAFVQSFLVTYPMNSQGVVAASVPNLLRTILKESNSWEELKKNITSAMEKEKSGSITFSALSFIQQKLADLELKSLPCTLEPKDIVLDFSGLNESAKSFYAELYLRQAWHTIEASQPDPMSHIIIIDEAHRLLKSEATIFGEVARLIRSRGALWCGTQNYSDLPDYVRNQFAMHLLFSTKSEKDLKALKAINDLLPYVATELEDYHFTDAAARELHDAIPIYTASISSFKDYPEVYIAPAAAKATPQQEKPALDYKGCVLDLVTREACWPSELARRLVKEGADPQTAKMFVCRALKALREDGAIERRLISLDGGEVSLYYRRDPSMSGLHRFMEREVTKRLENQGIAYELAKPGEDKPDIITKDFDIEIETGLKHDITKLEEELADTTKEIRIVVPSDVERGRYQKVIKNPLIIVSSLLNF